LRLVLFLYFLYFSQDHEPDRDLPDLVFKSRKRTDYNQIIVLTKCFQCFGASLLNIVKHFPGGIDDHAVIASSSVTLAS